MLQIAKIPFAIMKAHAEAAYPNECVGAMLGNAEGAAKTIRLAMPLENAARGSQRAFYELSDQSLFAAEEAARKLGLGLIGIYHSHPDADAYFSETDLKRSCPWYSYVVLSVREGRFAGANCWLADFEQTRADPEALAVAE